MQPDHGGLRIEVERRRERDRGMEQGPRGRGGEMKKEARRNASATVDSARMKGDKNPVPVIPFSFLIVVSS